MEQNINTIIRLLIFIIVGVTYLIGGLPLVGVIVAVIVINEIYKLVKIFREN